VAKDRLTYIMVVKCGRWDDPPDRDVQRGLLRYVAERETVPGSLDLGTDNCSSA
jgi:hypothetical protein